MPTRIKIFHLNQKLKTLIKYFLRNAFIASCKRSKSISLHDIALFYFDNQIWFNQWKNIIKHGSGSLPIINGSSELLFTGPSVSGIFRATEGIFEPNNKLFIARCNSEQAMPLKSRSIFSLFDASNIKTTFSINYSSKIRNLRNSMRCFVFDNFNHKFPFIDYHIIINNKNNFVHGERLSEKNSKEYAIV